MFTGSRSQLRPGATVPPSATGPTNTPSASSNVLPGQAPGYRFGTAAPAPAPAPTPASPQPPTMDSSSASWDALRNKYQGEGDKIFADGSLGRITDAHAGQTDDLLKYLHGQLGGMTSQENQAAIEQAMSGIGREQAQNQEKYASIAGANGIHGGASAALQGRSIRDANQQTADFRRQLILDNISLKGQAADRYSGVLGGASDRALGVQTQNNDLKNRELTGRVDYPIQMAAGATNAYGNDFANYLGQRGADIAQGSVDALKNIGGYSGTAAPSGKAGSYTSSADSDPTRAYDGRALATSPNNSLETNTPAQQAATNASAVPQSYTDALQKKADEALATASKNSANRGKIICTEANRQGLLSDSLLATSRAYGRQKMSLSAFKGYWTWGEPTVLLMRRYGIVARAVAALLPVLIAEEAWEIGLPGSQSKLAGRFLLRAFHAANQFCAQRRARRLSVAGA